MSATAKLTDMNDLAAVKGKRAVARAVADALPPALARDVVDGEAWPDLVIPGAGTTPEISAALLPSWVGGMVQAVSDSTQTPSAMGVLIALAVLATTLQRRFVVAPKGDDDDYTETLSLWTLVGMVSGSRKTAVVNALTAPLMEWEERERLALRTSVAKNASERAVSQARIKKLTDRAAGEEEVDKRRKLLAEIDDIKRDMPDEMHFPKLFTADTTPEALQAMLTRQGERMAVLADEPGVFNVMAGMYSGGKASLDVFLQSHAGSPVRVDRADREAYLVSPALSFGVTIQPGILCEVGDNRQFRHSGLLARFLYALPASNIGKRNVRKSTAIAAAVKDAYHAGLMSLLEGRKLYPDKPLRLNFSEPATEAWYVFAEEVERQQGDGGRFEAISDWTGKLPGQVARIAALIELAESGTTAESVSLSAVERAVELARLLIEHAIAVFGMIGADDGDAGALAILRWIRANGLTTFNRTAVYRAMEARFGNVEQLGEALKRLSDWGVIRQNKVTSGKRGGRPSEIAVVNPKVFT
jgi:hypothetical protein